MLNADTRLTLTASFPDLAPILLAAGRELSTVELPSGAHICLEGDECGQLALLLAGRVRVYKLSEAGREITLYRLAGGDSCVLTASCILSNRPFPAFALTEAPSTAVLVPASRVHALMGQDAAWRAFIFGLIAERLGDIIAVLDDVAFGRMDRRVAAWILRAHQNHGTVQATHQALASDLGSSREVVTRILKSLQAQGLIEVSRGQIEVLDIAGLERKTVNSNG